VYQHLGSQIGYTTEPKDISPWFVRGGVLLALLGAVLSLIWTNRLL
jgi:Ca-activated chloride channel family protein